MPDTAKLKKINDITNKIENPLELRLDGCTAPAAQGALQPEADASGWKPDVLPQGLGKAAWFSRFRGTVQCQKGLAGRQQRI